jgi:membrane fusion protein, copper/silver efflux system
MISHPLLTQARTNWRSISIYAAVLIVGFIAGGLLWSDPHAGHDHAVDQDGNVIWTCSMHPQIREEQQGKCPLCGMDLTPLNASSTGADPSVIRLSANELNLAGVRTTIIGGAKAGSSLSLVGKVTPDERNRAVLTAHIGGRIEDLNVDFKGSRVYAGQILAEIYSPELYQAQQELQQFYKLRTVQPNLYSAARAKIALWKFSEEEIDQMAKSSTIQAVVPIRAERNGIVTNLVARKGMYVERGEMLMEIDDLSTIWIIFDAYEQDMSRIRVGQSIEISTDALPGEKITSSIRFIDPSLNPETRTVGIRVEVENTGNKLKPDMLVRGALKQTPTSSQQAITVPSSAVLWTGSRSIVYVKESASSSEGSGFRMVDIVLGARNGDFYEVKKGLKLGDEVVTHAAFTIDSAAQLQGMESMMSQRTQRAAEDIELQKAIVQAIQPYLALKDALVASDDVKAAQQAQDVLKLWQNFSKEPTDQDEKGQWPGFKSKVVNAASATVKSSSLESRRAAFEQLSDAIIALLDRYGVSGTPLYKQYCPMAFNDKGSYWISSERAIRNPYFGSAMLACGEVRGTWE